MGNDCFASTPNQYYNSYLSKINVSELKDLWQTVKLYKIKKIFDSNASEREESKQTHIPFKSFIQMFSQFDRYEQIHKRRLYQIFDNQSQGFIDWNNFYSTISICYFGPQQILSVFMFMIFDQSLSKQLTFDQLQLMIQLNSFALKKTTGQQTHFELQPNQIAKQLLKSKTTLTIDQWIHKSTQYFDFSKYRRLFNVFKEERIQKELITNFVQWNDLYVVETQKYVSYVVSYKWFQTWKIYVQENYGVIINTNYLKTPTAKTMRGTKKHIGKKEIKTLKKITDKKTLKQIQYKRPQKPQSIQYQENIGAKDIDFIHNNIGQRPRQIYNNVLQGQFQQVLKSQLVQNRDYVLVSEKVWKALREIYGGGPQFRRTGFDSIELYPKIVKIFSSLFRNQIDYSSQIIRQVSGYLTIYELFTRSVDLTIDELKEKKIYYKTIGMIKWEQVDEFDYMFSELTSDILIFLIYIDKSQEQNFKKTHSKLAKQISLIHTGDYVKYCDPQTKVQKTAVFMGKNIQGKSIFHFPKQSYTYDKCLIDSQTIKYCKIYSADSVVNEIKLKNKGQSEIKGISNNKGLGFINSMMINLFNNKKFKNIINMINTQQDDQKMLFYLADIHKVLAHKNKVDIRDIQDMIELYLPRYQNFQMSLGQQFILDFYTNIVQQLTELSLNQGLQQSLQIRTKSSKKCLKCKTQQKDEITDYCISIPLPDESQLIYQIVLVPICTGLRSTQIKKYGICLSKNATLKNLKDKFQAISQIDKKRPYILTQVYSNRIIKNYNSIDLNTSLEKLRLRDGDALYAFQLYVDFNNFIDSHYSTSKTLTSKQVKVDSFIDCRHNEKGWIYGKICEIEHLPYTKQTLVKVLHKFSKNEQWQVRYDLNEQCIAKFPTRCYSNAQQYHLQLSQRYFNQATNQMQICNIPLTMVLTSWMRWKQFSFLVYLQVKRFISQAYALQDCNQDDEQLENYRLASSKDIKSTKKINNVKAFKFKQYLTGKDFPYKLNLVDADGRCAICFKFLKANIFKGQSANYCEGCQLSNTQPICWQIKVADLVISVDWKNLSCIQRDIVTPHSSLINLTTNKKLKVQNLNNCLKDRFEPYTQQQELLCCNLPFKVQNEQILDHLPQMLPIYLQRVALQSDGYKKINKASISFPVRGLKLKDSVYNLVGVTSIEGNNRNIKYKTYTIKEGEEHEWIQYDGEHTKVVKEAIVEKVCALVLYYKRAK